MEPMKEQSIMVYLTRMSSKTSEVRLLKQVIVKMEIKQVSVDLLQAVAYAEICKGGGFGAENTIALS